MCYFLAKGKIFMRKKIAIVCFLENLIKTKDCIKMTEKSLSKSLAREVLRPGKTLGQRIRQVRNKLSQDAFAVSIGISRGSLSAYERDESQPSADILKEICTKWKISADWLLLGSEDRPQKTISFFDGTRGVNAALLSKSILVVEEGLSKKNKILTSEKKAELIAAVYDFIASEETIDTANIIRFINALY